MPSCVFYGGIKSYHHFSCLSHSHSLSLSFPENELNLREENKQLRKAHQDIYVQLQDTRVKPKSPMHLFSAVVQNMFYGYYG